MVRTFAIVTVRNSSKRLPQKAIMEILGEKTIEIVIERAKITGYPVIVATSTHYSDDIFEQIAKSNGVEIFRGSLLNKLKRWKDCFDEFAIDSALLVDGDDLLYNYQIGKRAIEQLETLQADIVKHPDNIVCGFFTYAICYNAFIKMDNFTSNENLNTDIITEFLDISPLNTMEVSLNEWEKNRPYRLTLDYQEDFAMFRILISKVGTNATGKEIIEFLDSHKEIAKINIHRQKDYLENQKNFNRIIRQL
ncbi:MAG: acylneuraminate cytidylyltransferase [Planctomycetes bacterium]|nr:acylneuraminate cytidylyltransferase [Planctomycetota bacterium]